MFSLVRCLNWLGLGGLSSFVFVKIFLPLLSRHYILQCIANRKVEKNLYLSILEKYKLDFEVRLGVSRQLRESGDINLLQDVWEGVDLKELHYVEYLLVAGMLSSSAHQEVDQNLLIKNIDLFDGNDVLQLVCMLNARKDFLNVVRIGKALSGRQLNERLYLEISSACIAIGEMQLLGAMEPYIQCENVSKPVVQRFFQVRLLQGDIESAVAICAENSFLPEYMTWDALTFARALLKLKRFNDVISFVEPVLNYSNAVAELYPLVAQSYVELGNLEDAQYVLRLGVNEYPEDINCSIALGSFLMTTVDEAEGQAVFDQLFMRHPGQHEPFTALGMIYFNESQFDKAIIYFESAMKIRPDSSLVLNNLGAAYREKGEFSLAYSFLSRAEKLLTLNPKIQDIGLSLIKLNQLLCVYDLADYDKLNTLCSELSSDATYSSVAQWYQALSYLANSKFHLGWEAYKSRWLTGEIVGRPYSYKEFSLDVAKKDDAILVYAEQGIGDEIMFASCLREFLEEYENVVVECSPKLVQIFRCSFPSVEVVAADNGSGFASGLKTRKIDFQIPIGDLPSLYRNSHEAFASHVSPYLSVDRADFERWKVRLRELGGGVKVGISWAGGTKKSRSGLRGVDLEEMIKALDAPGIIWVNLQYGECQEDIDRIKRKLGVEIYHFEETRDYYQTAALVSALDCVVSVQTAIVHLSGALGKVVYCLAPEALEWRYRMTDESFNLLWYPSVRLFLRESGGGLGVPLGAIRKLLIQNYL